MAVVVPSQIQLNGEYYTTKGGVNGAWADNFNQQITIGDADYSNRLDLSSWTIKSPLYIGVEEADEKKDANFCWWTNCITSYQGHTLPPRLAHAVTLPAALTDPTVVDPGFESTGGWVGGDDSSTYAHTGTYSRRVGLAATGDYDCYQDVTGYTVGNQYTATVYVKLANTGDWTYHAHIILDDGVTATESSAVDGPADWTLMTVTKTIALTATQLRITLRMTVTVDGGVGGNPYGYFDDVTLDGLDGTGTTVIFANFNSELYAAYGRALLKLNAGRTALERVVLMPATIVDLIASLNSRLYIYLGSTNYYYMSTAEAFTQSNSANATWGVQHDAKLFKMNTSGTVAYSTDPDGATPTWSSAGAITDIAAQIEGFVVGRDASGNVTLYVATNSILKAYDDTTPQWIDTEAKLPNHPIGGQGRAYWNGKLYLSYGLAVKEYYPETGAFIDVGLTERDGLPAEYNGEIVKLLGDTGVKGMFAAVDASVPSGNSKSGLYLYDGYGWQCWWVDTSNDGAMKDIIVSPAKSAYAVYWNCGTSVYYIDIPRGVQNPDKITQYYGTSGIFISSWFDAGDPTAAKLAKYLDDFAKGVTTTETVALYYRIDHATTTLDLDHSSSYWTLVETLNTTGESGFNTELFASGAGVSYKSIQFRMDFVTAGSTAKADIQSLTLRFDKRTGSEKKRVWWPTVVIVDDGRGKARKQVANLKGVIESATDVLFSYHTNADSTEEYYVKVNCPKFIEYTGKDYSANYDLTLTEA